MRLILLSGRGAVPLCFRSIHDHPIQFESKSIRLCCPNIATSMDAPESSAPSASRGRGRGKSRGGLGKYLRARGRGRGRGRPAEFGKRLVLEDEQEVELDEEETKELEKKYARRQLGTNADRYAEPEPELDSDGTSSIISYVS